MSDYLELWKPEGAQLVPLEGERLTVGRSDTSDLSLTADRSVSRVHAVFELVGGRWCIRDMGSRNGTFVGGARVMGERSLRDGEEVRVGDTRLVFRTQRTRRGESTAAGQAPPELTRREREVLAELCRPALSQGLFREPASIRQIASALFISDAAVKQHLGNLYAKFDILGDDEESERRRVRLANEAVRRGAVNVADLVSDQRETDDAPEGS